MEGEVADALTKVQSDGCKGACRGWGGGRGLFLCLRFCSLLR